MMFHTETGALYEVDEAGQRVRRLLGVGEVSPNPHTWRGYTSAVFVEGYPAVIVWEKTAGAHPCTFTGRVTRVER